MQNNNETFICHRILVQLLFQSLSIYLFCFMATMLSVLLESRTEPYAMGSESTLQICFYVDVGTVRNANFNCALTIELLLSRLALQLPIITKNLIASNILYYYTAY